MKSFKTCLLCSLVCCLGVSFLPLPVSAQIPDPKTYIPSTSEIEKHKKPFDDPRPYLKEFGPKQVLPKDLYAKLSFDEEKMRSLWSEIVGFRAPDVVGKIAPEIKPGKYRFRKIPRIQAVDTPRDLQSDQTWCPPLRR